MKKVIKISLYIALIICIGVILFFTIAFFGNPISPMLCNHSVKGYLAENYSNFDFEIEKARYNLKDGTYFVYVQSKDSVDTRFSIDFNVWGKPLGDNYHNISYNTWQRFNNEIKAYGDALCKENLNEKFSINLGIYYEENPYENNILKLDQKVDIDNFPFDVEVNIEYFSETPSYEDAYYALETVHKLMKKEKFKIKEYDIINIPMENINTDSWNGALTIFDIPVTIFEEENPAEALKKYYEKVFEDFENQKKNEMANASNNSN